MTDQRPLPIAVYEKEDLVAWLDFEGEWHVKDGVDPKHIVEIIFNGPKVSGATDD